MESAEEVYQQHVKPLSPSERLRLLAMTAQDLAEEDTGAAERSKRRIMELHDWARKSGAELIRKNT